MIKLFRLNSVIKVFINRAEKESVTGRDRDARIAKRCLLNARAAEATQVHG